MINATQTTPARQQSAPRIHADWCMTVHADGDCTWVAGYVPAAEGDCLVTVRQADGYDPFVTLTTASSTITLAGPTAEFLQALLGDAALETTNGAPAWRDKELTASA